MVFEFPDGSIVRSSNITPHPTGIGAWTEQQFMVRFRLYADTNYAPQVVSPGEFQTMMPWMMYGLMTETDLKAMFAYLMTLEPVEKVVIRFTPKNRTAHHVEQ